MALREEKLLRGQSEKLQLWRLHADKSTAQMATCEGLAESFLEKSCEPALMPSGLRYKLRRWPRPPEPDGLNLERVRPHLGALGQVPFGSFFSTNAQVGSERLVVDAI